MCGHDNSDARASSPNSNTAGGPELLIPDPTETLVAQNIPDGYWLEAFYFHKDDKFPDLVGYGLGFPGKPSTITHYVNPKNSDSHGGAWNPIPIQPLDFPVSMAFADFTGDGFNDIVICDHYGPSMDDLWDAESKDGGRVQYLKNPGDRFAKKNWQVNHIGNSTGMHRLKVGHFTTRDHSQPAASPFPPILGGTKGIENAKIAENALKMLTNAFSIPFVPPKTGGKGLAAGCDFEVMGLPIISATSDRTSPAPILVWTPVYESKDAAPVSWTEDIPFPNEFRLIHEVKPIPGEGGALDTSIVAGREGVVHLYYDETGSAWKYVVIGTGLAQQPGNPYWGSGTVDVAAMHDDPVGYIATCEAFHGNTVSVYLKRPGAPKGTASLYDAANWKRVQIDNYGSLDPKTHTGTIHHVSCANFDGTGVSGFAIACMGEPIGKVENQGVYIYRPTNLREGKFHKSKITDRSAARLAIASFSGKTLDVASISYFVPNYHTGPIPASIRINPNAFFSPLSTSDIRVQRLDKEVLLMVPQPKSVFPGTCTSMPLITVAGRRLHIVVLPPQGTVKYNPKDGVKVIHGEILMRDDNGKVIKRGLALDRHTAATMQICASDGIIKAGAEGAVFMQLEHLVDHVQGLYRTMADLPIANVFPGSVQLDVQALQFPFIKVDQLPWASNDNWDGFEFYNMTGFHVYFGDGAMDKICHIQLWTLGLYETARFHVHDTIPFCEIHCCIANGGGSVGMRWFPDEVSQVDPKLELDGDWVEERTDRLIYPPLYEHGPLWKVQEGYNAKPKLLPNGCADYPYHGWLASRFGERKIPVEPPVPSAEQSYDVWLAFEFPLSSFQY